MQDAATWAQDRIREIKHFSVAISGQLVQVS